MSRSLRRGITLTELLVAITVLGLVLTLLAFPLLSAFGYIQKAIARGEAQRAGGQARVKLMRDISTALYVFDIPPDGSWVALVPESTSDTERGLGMPMDFGGKTKILRYARMLEFPWVFNKATNKWVLLAPNYEGYTGSAIISQTYANSYVPFHFSQTQGLPVNPYFLARIESPEVSWASATIYALDGSYPMNQWDGGLERTELLRTLRNSIPASTPFGGEWDIPEFKTTPMRVNTESLSRQQDARGKETKTVYLARWPLWCGRSQDIDNLTGQAELGNLYHCNSAQIGSMLSSLYPLRRYPGTNTNPFGYTVKVFDSTGKLAYGTQYSPTLKKYTLMQSRHFMDWPPIDRPDAAEFGYLWTADEIARHRIEGKLVFAQPMRVSTNAASTYYWCLDGYTAGTETDPLPIPDGWVDDNVKQIKTYLSAAPNRIVLINGAKTRTYKLVDKDPADLVYNEDEGTGEFCIANAVNRTLAFGPPPPGEDWNGTWTIRNAASAIYYICDIQEGDVVVANYTTKSVLDVALTVSRKDQAARVPEQSRQDYSVNLRVEARNAIKRARGNQ